MVSKFFLPVCANLMCGWPWKHVVGFNTSSTLVAWLLMLLCNLR